MKQDWAGTRNQLPSVPAAGSGQDSANSRAGARGGTPAAGQCAGPLLREVLIPGCRPVGVQISRTAWTTGTSGYASCTGQRIRRQSRAWCAAGLFAHGASTRTAQGRNWLWIHFLWYSESSLPERPETEVWTGVLPVRPGLRSRRMAAAPSSVETVLEEYQADYSSKFHHHRSLGAQDDAGKVEKTAGASAKVTGSAEPAGRLKGSSLRFPEPGRNCYSMPSARADSWDWRTESPGGAAFPDGLAEAIFL